MNVFIASCVECLQQGVGQRMEVFHILGTVIIIVHVFTASFE